MAGRWECEQLKLELARLNVLSAGHNGECTRLRVNIETMENQHDPSYDAKIASRRAELDKAMQELAGVDREIAAVRDKLQALGC